MFIIYTKNKKKSNINLYMVEKFKKKANNSCSCFNCYDYYCDYNEKINVKY